MNRLNGRIATGIMGNPADRDGEFEPSCLVRTPSGNVYIPTDIPKNSPLDYKSNSSCSSPSKGDIQKNSERCSLPFGTPVPVLPVRNNLRRPNSSHFPQSRFQFRKGFATKCTWKCTAIVFIILSVVLTAALTYMSAANLLNWSYQSAKACSVLVGENPEVFPKVTPEANRTTPRVRPTGGKFADLPPVAPLHSHNRWRRSVNQHAPPSHLNVVIKDPPHGIHHGHDTVDVDVVHDADLTLSSSSVHETLNTSVSLKNNGSYTSPEGKLPVSEHVVPVPLNVSDFNTNENKSEKSQDLQGSLADDSTSQQSEKDHVEVGMQHDYPIFSYGQPEVEIVKLHHDTHESVTLKTGPGVPPHTSPDANQLTNEVKEIIPAINPKINVLKEAKQSPDNEDNTESYEEDNNTERYLREKSHPKPHPEANPQFMQETTTLQYKNEFKNFQTSMEHSVNEDSLTRQAPLEQSESVNDKKHEKHQFETHESKLTIHPPTAFESDSNDSLSIEQASSMKDVNLTSLPRVEILSLVHEVNGSARHATRVLVNVTIATEDESSNNDSNITSGSHHPVYVLSVSLPTDGDASKVANIDIIPPVQGRVSGVESHSQANFSVNESLRNVHSPPIALALENNSSSFSTLLTKNSSLSVPTTTQYPTILPTSPEFPWGAVCECSCPCMEEKTSTDKSDENDYDDENTHETLSDKPEIITENVTVNVSTNLDDQENKHLNDVNTRIDNLGEGGLSEEYLVSNISTTNLPEDYSTGSISTEQTTLSEDILTTPAFPDYSVTAVPDEENITLSSTDSSSAVSSSVDCPVVTPPPPVILILEGEAMSSAVSSITKAPDRCCFLTEWCLNGNMKYCCSCT